MSFVLEATTRTPGKGSQLTEIRDNSKVPGVIYGFEQDSLAITVGYSELIKILKEAGTSNIIDLKLEGQDKKVIVKNYDQDPVSDRVIHADFLLINDKRPLTTVVPLEFVGTSRAVKEQGGKVNIKSDQVLVKCLPADLPATLKIDLNILSGVGKSILVEDIEVSDKVKILTNGTDPVVSVNLPKKGKLIEETVAEAVEPVKEGEEADKKEETKAEETK
ncbi:50S ribosomal protein L25 [Candidatus Nomurabacteria bacterium]|nr:50S ribosomal protein L25 [Candidatus Nomurabacteria bacterium]